MANTIDNHYFFTLFDEFKTVPVVKVDAYIGIASTRVDAATWGVNSQYATALLTAHMLAAGGGQGGHGGSVGGPITQETVGDLSRSYGTVGVPGSGMQELLTTRYGQMFVELRRETIVPAMVTGTPTPMPPLDTVLLS